MIRALVVDDERLARAAMRRLLGSYADVQIVGEAANADQAAMLLRTLTPDVMFLDIEMPGATGLDLLRAVAVTPLVVFTTAYSEHAVQAFEVGAIDYLVKPVADERLAATLEKVRHALSRDDGTSVNARQLLLRDGERSWIVRLDRIRLLESDRNSTRVYFGEDCAIIHRSLTTLAAHLDSKHFVRVNRSQIVNLQHVTSLVDHPGGRLVAAIAGGGRVQVSRRAARALRRRLAP